MTHTSSFKIAGSVKLTKKQLINLDRTSSSLFQKKPKCHIPGKAFSCHWFIFPDAITVLQNSTVPLSEC